MMPIVQREQNRDVIEVDQQFYIRASSRFS